MALLEERKAEGRQRTKDSMEGAGVCQRQAQAWNVAMMKCGYLWQTTLSESGLIHSYHWPYSCSRCCFCYCEVFFFSCGNFIFLWWTQVNTSFCLADITAGTYSEYLKNLTVWQGSVCSLSWLLLCSWSLNIISLRVSMNNGPYAQLAIIWLFVRLPQSGT